MHRRLFIVTSTIVSFLVISSFAQLPQFEQPIKPDASLSLLAIGDWGRKGTFNQSLVAKQMGRIGEELGIDFVISVGDNFYDAGLIDVYDKSFEESFTNIYTAKSLQKQWYAVLGNHDYRGNAVAQLDPILRDIDKRWLCLRSFMVNTDIAQFFFIDTTPFVKKYWKHPKKNHYDWRGVAPRKKYISKVLKDLEIALSESTSIWKVVVGHHTIRSVSEHGDTDELVDMLLPMLEASNFGVDLYMNGHDHCLEHISSDDSPIQFLTTGGGSKAWRGIFNPNKVDTLRLFYDGQGFISLQLTKTDAKVVYYDVDGNVIHTWSRTKDCCHPYI
ncbi:purple acid phosphatase 8-like [Dioscorea cayenensis subsp. rotundata]|uniref:Purple acid phosphatase n=1 Tax=Dioscorea cayennensis subsp. rotundata TaxID=55577 RepID=A0AB40BJY9_DIOCR|nr:purple acid phosphatase 8-like [Dioscorea cayenensis subsp. rotundata]